jgi:hypothetical protein
MTAAPATSGQRGEQKAQTAQKKYVHKGMFGVHLFFTQVYRGFVHSSFHPIKVAERPPDCIYCALPPRKSLSHTIFESFRSQAVFLDKERKERRVWQTTNKEGMPYEKLSLQVCSNRTPHASQRRLFMKNGCFEKRFVLLFCDFPSLRRGQTCQKR